MREASLENETVFVTLSLFHLDGASEEMPIAGEKKLDIGPPLGLRQQMVVSSMP